MPLLSNLLLAVVGASGVVFAQGTTPPGPTQPGVPSNCNRWHVVKKGDSCATLESKYSISHTQFLTWNPAVSKDCITNFWPDYAYCVGVGAVISTSTTTTTTKTTTATRITSPPGPTFTGTPANCNSWHLVKAGEDCGTLESKYGISHSQFLQYNPAVSKDCVNNFWPNYAYCVGLGPPITTTSQTTTTTTTSSFNSTYSVRHPVTSWVISTPTIDNTTWPPTKTQAGQPSFCNNWHLVAGNQDCRAIWYMYSTWMTMADFFAWNPAVGTDCSGLFVNYYVCVGIQPQTGLTIALPTAANFTLPPYVSWTPQPLPPVNSSFTPTPSQGPMPTNCVNFHKAEPGNTCDNILAEHREITRDQFFGWNPVLAGDCNGLWANNYYCVGAYSNGNLPQPPTVNTKPSPMPPDSASNCVAWYKTTDGDTCADIGTMFGSFSDKEFKAWNPAVGGDCSGLRVGYWYCVAVPGTPTTRITRPSPSTTFSDTSTTSSTKPPSITSPSTSTTSRPTTTTSEAPISTPQPIQAPMTAGCRRFYFVKPGDGCWQISHDAGIALEDFYKWNPGAAPDCSGMWANIYVCVGITGPAATFSGTPPKPT